MLPQSRVGLQVHDVDACASGRDRGLGRSAKPMIFNIQFAICRHRARPWGGSAPNGGVAAARGGGTSRSHDRCRSVSPAAYPQRDLRDGQAFAADAPFASNRCRPDELGCRVGPDAAGSGNILGWLRTKQCSLPRQAQASRVSKRYWSLHSPQVWNRDLRSRAATGSRRTSKTARQEKIFQVHTTRFRAISASSSDVLLDSRAVERM